MQTINIVAQSGYAWIETVDDTSAAIASILTEHNDIDRVELLNPDGSLNHNLWSLSQVAATLGRKGGSVRSARKAASSRANGRKGGRPRKA